MTMTDPNAFLMSSGAKAFKFENPGDSVRGRITDLMMQQQRKMGTNELQYWDDGNPKMQLRVTLQTDLHDDENDDGLRSVYVRGQMQAAVREAIKAAGATSIEEGGTLAVKFEGLGPKGNFPQPPKHYKAKYEPPVRSVSTDDF